MKYSLYGLPCAGKTTLLEKISISVIHGSTELNKMANGKFISLSEEEKNELRIKYAQGLSLREDSFISDGHYSFESNIVFTDADAAIYDVFIYLYCDPEILHNRMMNSEKNARFSDLSVEKIRKWQNFEIENLRKECHRNNKDFYVVNDITAEELQIFISKTEQGFSSFDMGKKIVEQIQRIYPEPCELHICDGDKTIIKQDSFRICTDNYTTHVFDGSFYTGYQALKFKEEISTLKFDTSMLDEVKLNDEIYNMIYNKNYVVLSSGVSLLWGILSEKLNLKNVIADTEISADTKYYVTKLLQEKGYTIIAYGDGKNDLYMLKKADKGILYVGSYFNRSLRNSDTSGLQHIFDKNPFILENHTDSIKEEIGVCRSSSGVCGSVLADVHIKLGKKLGKALYESVPNINAAVLVLERGGRFFGDGIYIGFGGTFYSYNYRYDDFPDLHNHIVIITDSVINTGKSVLDIIKKIKENNPDSYIIIAANVIQNKALELLQDYKVFAVRISENSFVGSRQAVQKDGKGPDTADRLFNFIN